jgi:hypothetical protein
MLLGNKNTHEIVFRALYIQVSPRRCRLPYVTRKQQTIKNKKMQLCAQALISSHLNIAVSLPSLFSSWLRGSSSSSGLGFKV